MYIKKKEKLYKPFRLLVAEIEIFLVLSGISLGKESRAETCIFSNNWQCACIHMTYIFILNALTFNQVIKHTILQHSSLYKIK